MKAGDTEPTTPMLSAVVYCSATNCKVPNAAPPMSARKVSTPTFASSLAQSARICGHAKMLTARNTTTQRASETLAGGACPAIFLAIT